MSGVYHAMMRNAVDRLRGASPFPEIQTLRGIAHLITYDPRKLS